MIEPMTETRDLQITWQSIPFGLVHVAALVGVFLVPFSWSLVALCLGLYGARMFVITGGYHRYFSHRSYKTSRWFQLVLAVIGASTMQRGPLWWAAHHRHHHLYSDQHGDLHSPGLQGFLWAHVGWVLSPENDETDYARIADFAKYPELVFVNRNHYSISVLYCVALYAIGGIPWLIWGGFASTVLLWHGTFCINSLTHLFGRRRYITKDDSRNSFLMALITLGEGWHNNHHYYKASTRQGFFWWEIDITYYILRGLAGLGIVWDLKEPPSKVLDAGQRAAGDPLLDPLARARHPNLRNVA